MFKTIENRPLWTPRSVRRMEIIERDNPSKKTLFERIYAGKATRSQCIKGQCLDCVGFDSAAVKNCGDRLCPLWHVRPFHRKGTL